MSLHINNMSLIISVLAFSSLLSSAFSRPEPQERIVGGTMFPYDTKSIGTIVLQLSIPDNTTWYYTYCTAALIARDKMISSASCVKNAQRIQKTGTLNENRQVMALIGQASTSTEDVEAEGVIMNVVTDDKLTYSPRFLQHYNPDARTAADDLVIIHLDNPASGVNVFYPFAITTGIVDYDAATSMFPPFMLAWGEAQCKGFSSHARNYAVAQTVDCADMPRSTGQFCVNLTNAATGEPVYTAIGDTGAPIFNVQVRNNKYIYNMYGILSLTPKSFPGVTDPRPLDSGCSKSSIVVVTNLRSPLNAGFIRANNQNQTMPILRVPLQYELFVK